MLRERRFQFFATVHRGREGKGGRHNQAYTNEDESQNSDTKDTLDGATNTSEKKKGRPKVPCEPIESDPYVNIEIVKFGRDPNNTFSSGRYSFSTGTKVTNSKFIYSRKCFSFLSYYDHYLRCAHKPKLIM